MMSTLPFPKFIETKGDLDSLIPGDQVEFSSLMNFRPWVVFEGIIGNQIAFITRGTNRKNILSCRIDPKNIYITKEQGSIGVNRLYNMEFITYTSSSPGYSQKLKMLQEAGF